MPWGSRHLSSPFCPQTASLRKYRQHFKLTEVAPNSSKDELIPAVARHFADQVGGHANTLGVLLRTAARGQYGEPFWLGVAGGGRGGNLDVFLHDGQEAAGTAYISACLQEATWGPERCCQEWCQVTKKLQLVLHSQPSLGLYSRPLGERVT